MHFNIYAQHMPVEWKLYVQGDANIPQICAQAHKIGRKKDSG